MLYFVSQLKAKEKLTLFDVGVEYFAVVQSAGVIAFHSVTFHWIRRPVTQLDYTLCVLHHFLQSNSYSYKSLHEFATSTACCDLDL